MVPNDIFICKRTCLLDARFNKKQTSMLLGNKLQNNVTQSGTREEIQSHGISSKVLIYFFYHIQKLYNLPCKDYHFVKALRQIL